MDQVESFVVSVPIISLGEKHIVVVKIYKAKHQCPNRAVFCFPGGTYNKSYFDLTVENGDNYSLANTLTIRGNIVICIDHLGVGDSSKPTDGGALTRNVLADAGAAAVDFVTKGLRTGTLISEWPAITEISRIGVGHSLGGLVLLALQARHKIFDAIAVLGWSNQPRAERHAFRALEAYVQVDRTILRPFFHLADVPEHIIFADDLNAERVPAGILIEGQQDNISRSDAASVVVPVFLCYGERDLCPDPHLEPKTYPNSSDITMFRLLNSAHNHNFASSRLELFKRLSYWIGDILV